MGVILEVCVDSVASLAAAVAGGADRIELCAGLALGGLTPSVGFMAEAARCGLPVMAMIRPRAGDFVWSAAEVAMMEADISATVAAGLDGVVLGASLPDGQLDVPVLKRLVQAARKAESRSLRRSQDRALEGHTPESLMIPARPDLTLHRCFDLVPAMGEALEAAVRLGFRRILTSGGALTATAGATRIAALVARSAGRIAIMAGSGIRAENAPALKAVGVREFHGSCAESVAVSGRVAEMGFGPERERRTSAAEVRALRTALR